MQILKSCFYFSCLLLIFTSCGEDQKPTDSSNFEQIVIQMNEEPQRLNPILASSSYETEVFEYLFTSLCDYNPTTLKLEPVLVTEVPAGEVIPTSDSTKKTKYNVTIVPEAKWKDGSSITGYDFEFTMKLISLPSVNAPTWKALLSTITAIDVDPDDPRKFSVTMDGTYFLDKEGFLSAELYPAHIYDPNEVLGSWNYNQYVSTDGFFDKMSDQEQAAIKSLGESFSSVAFSKGIGIEGAGPYQLSSWETGQYLILERKANWWGDAYQDRSFLKANPEKIVFQFIGDETVTTTLLKSGELDMATLSKAAPQVYADLKSDADFSSRFDFYTPSLFRMYYILLNNKDSRLSDVNVRRALAKTIDMDRIIRQQEGGFAQQVNSIIHPAKEISNKSISMVSYDIQEANELLDQAGWLDSDGDGVRDKTINGVKESLSLRFFITGSSLSTSISSIVAESAKDAGIEIVIVTKPNRATQAENLLTGDFELTAQALTSSPSLDDPYNQWHSNSTGLNGRNWAGLTNANVDKLIETIRETRDEQERFQAYQDLQVAMAEELPVIFLYAPVEKYVVNKKFVPVISSNRPGYFANAFELSNAE